MESPGTYGVIPTHSGMLLTGADRKKPPRGNPGRGLKASKNGCPASNTKQNRK